MCKLCDKAAMRRNPNKYFGFEQASKGSIEKMLATRASRTEAQIKKEFENRSKAAKGRDFSNRRKTPCSEETKLKISRTLMGHKVSQETIDKANETKRRNRGNKT